MAYYLLDESIICELSKAKKNLGVVKKIAQYSDYCVISAITYQQISLALKKMPVGKKRSLQENFFYNYVLNTFPIIKYTTSEATVYADIVSNYINRGNKISKNGTQITTFQIAATAKANALILVTRNIKDFEPFIEHENLMVENWFE